MCISERRVNKTKWRRDRIGIAEVREEETQGEGRGRCKNARMKNREERREGGRVETKSCSESANANCKKDMKGEDEEERGEESIYIPRRFVFSLFPQGLLINYCD